MKDRTETDTAADSSSTTIQPPAAPTDAEARAARIAKENATLRNSLWCTDSRGRVGMINEINGAEVVFHYADGEGKLGAAVRLPQEELKIARASELPTNHGLTAQQCADTGYL
jgi:hypothetical protein